MKNNTSTQRDVFFDRLFELANNDHNLYFISADQGAPSLDKFRDQLPSQYINVGIAEQQALLLASGLALEGKNVYAHAIASFITLRCYEQIKLGIGAMNIPVKIVGVGAGFSYDDSGPTHHSVEDLTILRTLPNMVIHNITDAVMAKAFADITYQQNYPCYIRLDRKKFTAIYSAEDDFSLGLKEFVRGNEICIVATGNMVHRALEVEQTLRKNHQIEIGVIDVYTLPLNNELFLKRIKDYQQIITLEEHSLSGGFGSAIGEALLDNDCKVPLKRLGLSREEGYCYQYGGRENLQLLNGLDEKTIVSEVLSLKNKLR